ncbi:MAG: GEVED domain-containing protein [Chloroherpetonaceae bacterium]
MLRKGLNIKNISKKQKSKTNLLCNDICFSKILRSIFLFFLFITFFIAHNQLNAQTNFFINQNATVKVSQNAIVQINGHLTISTGAVLTQDANNIIALEGDFENNGTFANNNDTLLFTGGFDQNIKGSQLTQFRVLSINKTSGKLLLQTPTRIENSLRFISNTIFDLTSKDLTISPTAKIFSDNGITEDYTTFSANKCIVNSGSSSDPLQGAYLIKELPLPSPTLPYEVQFPISTPGVYTPLRVRILANGATFGSNPAIKVKPVPLEHPEVEVPNVSLKKYWVVKSSNVSLNTKGGEIFGYYNASEVQGNEGSYKVLLFSPSWNLPDGYWRIEPGVNNYVNFNTKYWYSQQTSILDGDWTIGESNAGQATYYSRADGDYNDPNTWSKIYYDGAASTTIPNKRSDRVKIQNHTVTISDITAPANIIAVEMGTEGRTAGILKIQSDNVVKGDTFRLESNAKLYIGHTQGIDIAPNLVGAIRSDVRQYSVEGIYGWWGGNSQVTGLGIPDIMRAFIVEKDPNTTVQLSKNSSITDSLTINSGTLDLQTNSLNGYTPNRTMRMRGGEMIVRGDFLLNYAPPSFDYGQITFDGLGNTVIPSSGSNPGVLKYNDLFVKGNRSGNITFQTSGEIRIKNSFDITNLNFSSNSYGFQTAGSTIRFFKNGVQAIPFQPASPVDSLVNIRYYNLIIDSAGIKGIQGSNASTFVILNNLIIEGNSQFQQNNPNIELQGNWQNILGKFIPNSAQNVIFTSPSATINTTITSRDTIDNPFENVYINGSGGVKPLDNLLVRGDLTFAPSSNLILENTNLYIQKNWINNGGTFLATNGNVIFEGNSLQSMSKISGNETFWNIELKNSANLNFNAIGTSSNNGIIVQNNLQLTNGRMDARNRFIQVNGQITRPGGGYINSTLRRYIDTASYTLQYEVGYETNYTPITLSFNGSAGTRGIVQVLADTISTTTSPISWTDGIPSDINPSGSQISPYKHIARQWNITIPSGSTFSLGNYRKYSATAHFISGVPPNGDLRNGTDPTILNAVMRTSSQWIQPLQYGSYPYIVKYNDSTRFADMVDFGSIMLGEPGVLTFFTRGNGNWTDPSNWSQIVYDGTSSSIYPGQTTNVFQAFIGKDHSIVLNSNVTVDTLNIFKGKVIVDSSGVLDLSTNVVSGSGEFRILKYGTVKIADLNGINATGATGNVRTFVRSYNYNSHNLGTFIYSGNGAQNTGTGLPSQPDTTRVLIIDKPSGNLTLNTSNTLHIKDSVYIKSGGFSLGSIDLNLYGNMRKASSAAFLHNNRTVYIKGIKGDTLTSENYNQGLAFYNLTVSKSANTGHVLLDTLTWLQIDNNLTFSNNKSVINATSKRSDSKPLFVTFGTSATVTGANHFNSSQYGGWIYGEVRKNIEGDNAPIVIFETGSEMFYAPFRIDFANGSGSAAGYLGVYAIDGFHPKLYSSPTSLYPVNPNRAITNYWKIKKIKNSTFVRGNRNYTARVDLVNPDKATLLDCFGCADLAYYRGGDSLQWWQALYANGQGENNNLGGGLCSDTRFTPVPTPNFSYSGTACGSSSVMAFIQVNNVTTAQAFGNQEIYASGDTLLADFVAGNRNSIKYYNFYSIKDGDWSDPTTWSTVSFSSSINEAATDPDPLIRPYPVRQYDNVIIGNNKKVVLNTNIGHNDYDGASSNIFTYVGPSVSVENTGTLIFGTRVLRGNTFNAFKGSTIVIGSISGINTGSTGNVIHGQFGAVPKFNDSINVIYTSEGQTANVQSYDVINRNASTHYIERLIMKRNSDGGTILDNFTGNKGSYSSYGHNFQFDKKAVLTAGQSYYIQINPSNNTANRKIKMWIDLNYNGNYGDTGEQLVNMNTNNDTVAAQSPAFTIPATTPQGTTQMRVGINRNTADFGPTDAGQGEFEEYTIDIANPNGALTQVSGAAIPGKLASLQVNSPRDSSTVELQKSIEVVDSVKIMSGILKASNGSNNYYIRVVKNFINDTINGFNPASAEVEFFGSQNSNIRGSQPITFNKLKFNKSNTDSTITINNNIYINDSLNFITNNKAIINDNYSLTFNQNSRLNGTFSTSRMFKVSGATSGGKLVKIFPSTGGSANFKQFTFPIGFDTIYNPVSIYDTASSYSGLPKIEVKLLNGKHPNRLADNILNRYWNINTQNFTNIDSIKFVYHKANVTGDTTKYVPALYASGFWQIDVGINPWAKSSPIIIRNTSYFNGDWTAGEPNTFSSGRVFYSRNSGDWNNYLNWSTDNILQHSGPASSYYPGLLFESDTVNIDGHNIVFNLDSCKIDSLRIGGTNPSPISGVLQFGTNLPHKRLFTKQVFLDNDNGSIVQNTGITTVDTLFISKNLLDNSSNGIFFQDIAANHKLALKFNLSGNSLIYGSGKFSKINDIILEKSGGLSDSLIISSASFTDSSMTSNPAFSFKSGVLVNNVADTLLISNPTYDIDLKPFSAIYSKVGRILTKKNITLFANSNITLDGGILEVGDYQDEALIYQTGSRINLINGEINIAGGLIRQNTSSYPEISISNNSTFRVAKIGNTTADPSFDMRSVNSILNMNGGRIIVANSNSNANSDIEIDAESGSLMTAGKIQLGDSSFTTTTDDLKISGSMPIYDLHLVAPINTNNYKSKIVSLNFTVNHNIQINQRQSLGLNGNILDLKGDLYNYGNLIATPSASTTQPWRILLDGSGDQYFKNYNLSIPNLEIYSLSLFKTTGNLILGDNDTTTNSSIKINDNLEFQTDNLAYINALTYSQKVIIGPNSVGLGLRQITRNTLGHIFGTLSIYIPNSAQTRQYYVGADTIQRYRPVTLALTGENNTAGYIDVTLHNTAHPDTVNSGLLSSAIIPQYWTVQPAAVDGYQLGSDGKYKITTQFINPSDIPNGASIGLFEHRLHTPAYPPAATWEVPEFLSNSDTTVTSRNVIHWGDFIIGNPGIITFYSYNDGDWQNINSWSLSGYTINNPPTRIPNQNMDVVRIGNGKKITLQDGTYPTVRNVIVETYNGLTGYFQIIGDLNYFRGLSFNLENNNTLGIQHVDGIRPESDGNTGPVQTNARVYGTSRYIFNSTVGNQQTGTGIPNYVKTIICDNSSTSANRKVFLSNYAGAPTVNIIDTLYIKQGTFSGGNRTLRVLNSFVIDSNSNEGIFEPLSGKVIFDSTINHYIVLRNRSGAHFYDLELNKGQLFAKREGANPTDSTHIYVQNTLNFVNPSIFVLGDSTNLVIQNSNINAITNFSSNKYIRTSRSSGLLVRAFSATGLPKTYTFPIGSFETVDHYTPLEMTFQTVSQAGHVGSRVSPGDIGGFPGGHSHVSTAPNAEYLKRYWVIDSVTGNFIAKARFNYVDSDIFGTETNLDRLGRWRPPFEQPSGFWMTVPVPSVDYTLNFFETTSNYSSNEFQGDWTLGNIFAFKRIFYSRQSGNWNDPNSWTYDPTHSGPLFGAGIWPDNIQDSVVIGGGIGANPPHEITLNVNANVMGTALGLNPSDIGILNTQMNTISGNYFTMGDLSYLKIGSPNGISSLGNSTGNILTTQSRQFSANGIYEYNGSSNQIIGNGLPNTVHSLFINNSGLAGNNSVVIDKNINVQKDLSILQGVLDLQTFTANNSTSDGIMSISPNAYLRIGGNNNLLNTANNYSIYNIDTDSYIEFYGTSGTTQTITQIPSNLVNGLGNVLLTNAGTKIASNPLLIKGNLINMNPSRLEISIIDALQVRKSVINESQIYNRGILEIGN